MKRDLVLLFTNEVGIVDHFLTFSLRQSYGIFLISEKWYHALNILSVFLEFDVFYAFLESLLLKEDVQLKWLAFEICVYWMFSITFSDIFLPSQPDHCCPQTASPFNILFVCSLLLLPSCIHHPAPLSFAPPSSLPPATILKNNFLVVLTNNFFIAESITFCRVCSQSMTICITLFYALLIVVLCHLTWY